MSASERRHKTKGARKICCRIPLSALKSETVTRITRSMSKGLSNANAPAEGSVAEQTQPVTRTFRTKGSVKYFPEYMKYLEAMAQSDAGDKWAVSVQDDPKPGPVKITISLIRLPDGYSMQYMLKSA